MECPSSLYFRVDVNHCDFEQNVPECYGGTRYPIETTTMYTTTKPTDPTTLFPELGPCASSPNQNVAHKGELWFVKTEFYFIIKNY